MNALSSDNPLAQELIRAIGLSEAVHRFPISAHHIPGAANLLADAGSRAWTEPHRSVWTDHALSWAQTQVPPHLCKIHSTFSTIYRPQHSALATSSRAKYASTWRQWNAWCNRHGYSPWLDSSRQHHSLQVMLFSIECWRPRPPAPSNSAATVLSKIGHISWYYRRHRGFPVGLHAGHKLALQGLPRPPQRKRPTTVRILWQLSSKCDFSNTHDRVLWGLRS